MSGTPFFTLRQRVAVTLTGSLLLLALLGGVYLHFPQFGKAPRGARLERLKQSSHYRNGKFQNVHPTAVFSAGYSMTGEVYKTFLQKNPRKRPVDVLPPVKTDLLTLAPDRDVVVWFGHSSCFIQLDGKRFLLDPIFSGNASPVPGTVPAFAGTNGYSAADMPTIDYLLISHDHYDHLDYETVIALRSKVKHVVCGLGVGAHFERWGYDPAMLLEKDWYESVAVAENFTLTATPARHGSGRALATDNTLWLSFVLAAPTQRLFLSGDSGYDTHFAAIGRQYGPFDLAIIENGQYSDAAGEVHLLPEKVLQAAQDVRAKRLLPVHSAKFVLNRHPWDEPLQRISQFSAHAHLPLVTPLIGEVVHLGDTTQTFRAWWQGLD